MVYRRYANPKELINMYIRNRQFGKFVNEVIKAEQKRIEEEAEKEDDRRWWELYLNDHSDHGLNFIQWKKKISKVSEKKRTSDTDLDESGIMSIMKKTFKTIQFK